MAVIAGDPGLLAVAFAEREAMNKRTTHINKSTNISIANSNVGSINTGTIQSLNVKMNQLQQAGSPEMAEALHTLATAILKSNLPVVTRNDLTSQLEFVAGQAAAPPPSATCRW